MILCFPRSHSYLLGGKDHRRRPQEPADLCSKMLKFTEIWLSWMARARIEFADSRKSLDSRESLTEPLFCASRFVGLILKYCESQVWGDSRESLARYENMAFFCESIRANRPDSCCESPGHLCWLWRDRLIWKALEVLPAVSFVRPVQVLGKGWFRPSVKEAVFLATLISWRSEWFPPLARIWQHRLDDTIVTIPPD